MQIVFDVGYSRWVADVSGSELEALTALLSKATKCHSSWGGAEEAKTGVIEIEKEERLDFGLKVNVQPLTLREWIEPPKIDPAPAAKASLTPRPSVVETPDIRDFMDEQLASPAAPILEDELL